MKVLIFPLLLAVLCFLVFITFFKKSGKKKTKGIQKNKNLFIAFIIGIILLLGFASYEFFLSIVQPDTYCSTKHIATSTPPSQLKNAVDYFNLGDYNYDIGNCQQAITDYTKAIELNPNVPEVYNNRAYTNMRLQNYKDALSDLNKAIELRPTYVNALMNRGDIYNFYYSVNHQRALVDYNKIVSLGATKGNSVCGHMAMAQSNNLVPLALLRIYMNVNCK